MNRGINQSPYAASPAKHTRLQQRTAHSPPYHASRNALFDDTHGQPAYSGTPGTEAVGNSSRSSSSSAANDVAKEEEARPIHHYLPRNGTKQSSAVTQRQSSVPRNGVAARVRGRNSAPAARPYSGADAIAFQYYTHQQQERRLQQRERSPLPTQAATPPRPQQSSPTGRGVSAPTTPGSRGQRAPFSRTIQQQHQQQQQKLRGEGRVAQRSRSSTPPPPPSRTTTTPAPQDTSASQMPAPSPVQGETEGDVAGSAVFSQPSMPSTPAQEATDAAAHQYETYQLLRYYGGVFAVAKPRSGSSASSPGSSSPSLPLQGQESTSDGRSVLVEALRAQLCVVRRAAAAAAASEALPSTSTKGQRRHRVLPHVNTANDRTQNPTSAAAAAASTTAEQRAQAPGIGVEGPGGGAGGSRRRPPYSSGPRAPHQLRSRVVASRVGTEHRNRSLTTSRGSSATPAARRAPHHVQDFTMTIKPPHRHGLGGAPPPSSTPSSPRTPAEMRDASKDTALDYPEGTQVGGTGGLNGSLNPPVTVRPSSQSSQSRDTLDGQAPASLRGASREVQVRRVLPLSGVLSGTLPLVGAGVPGSELSPGAAAARRVYWEQQQQQRQQVIRESDEDQQHHLFKFNALADCAAIAAPRYPESFSTEITDKAGPSQQRHEFESISLDDSVLRSDAHSFPSGPAGPHDSPAAPANTSDHATGGHASPTSQGGVISPTLRSEVPALQ